LQHVQQSAEMTLPSEFAERKTLNLGSGRKYLADAFNVDHQASTNPDLVHDLNSIPWPLPDDHFETVLLADSLEHLEDAVATMEEVHRVCRDGAVVRITTPHFSSANSFIDPTHRHHFSYFSFDYFTGEHEFAFYTEKRFRKGSAKIIFYPTLVNKLIWRFANRYPQAYERRWAWMFPAWFLSFELVVVK
jgi:SAM-dependent methyltransferase